MIGPDPLVDEIRAIRHQISAEFDHDPERLCAYLREVQRDYDTQINHGAKPKTRRATNGKPVSGSHKAKSK